MFKKRSELLEKKADCQLTCIFQVLAVILFSFVDSQGQNKLPSPAEYLGYELGEQWTPHHRVTGYFKEVAEHSAMVEWQQYGTTYEGRELILVAISTEQNIHRKEEIRTENLERAGLLNGQPEGDKTAIMWFSYNSHGNEPSGSEAAMKTLYELVRPENPQAREWLKNTLVLIDPMLNPDGRERYVQWFRQKAGKVPNVLTDAREHHEPWPGGRTNHYYFDLNRDWVWATQTESRQRIRIYQSWLPHVHVDFHEQQYNNPYYFAPAAEPFHPAITGWQREFQHTIGKNHAEYFDRNDWLYFSSEVFDLFYPGYGDTYSIFNGSIGMTYEQAGHSKAGLGVIQADGDTLTLKDRLNHHFITGMSTIEVVSENAGKVVDQFEKYYRDAVQHPATRYKTFVIKGDNHPEKLRELFILLDRHKIQYGKAPHSGAYTGFNYQTGRTEQVKVIADDYIVSAFQPKSVLARIFFEPRPELTDSLTYDITAWEQHYAFGLTGYALTDSLRPVSSEPFSRPAPDSIDYETPHAYIIEWKTMNDLKVLSQLLRQDVRISFAARPFSIEGKTYNPGTLIIPRSENSHMAEQFDQAVRQTIRKFRSDVVAVQTGFVESGSDEGLPEAVRFLKKPRIALLGGEGTSANAVGEVWHFFDRQIGYPVTLLGTGYFEEVDLHRYDVLILPGGNYRNIIGTRRLTEIRDWIAAGGRLIALRQANFFLADKEGFLLKRKEGEGEQSDSEIFQVSFDDRRRSRISHLNTGSIFKVSMDNSHPLAYGYGDSYFSLKQGSGAFEYLDKGWNVGITKEGSHRSGFVGHLAKEKLENGLTFGVQGMGEGTVVYLIDNPLFRAFWQNGKLLFGNAVFMVGQQE